GGYAKWSGAYAKAMVASTATLITTDQCTATIGLQPLRIGFVDSTGRSFATDDPRLGMGFVPLGPDVVDPLGSPARVYKQHRPTTHYFGCGERTGGLEKTGSHQVFW